MRIENKRPIYNTAINVDERFWQPIENLPVGLVWRVQPRTIFIFGMDATGEQGSDGADASDLRLPVAIRARPPFCVLRYLHSHISEKILSQVRSSSLKFSFDC